MRSRNLGGGSKGDLESSRFGWVFLNVGLPKLNTKKGLHANTPQHHHQKLFDQFQASVRKFSVLIVPPSQPHVSELLRYNHSEPGISELFQISACA